MGYLCDAYHLQYLTAIRRPLTPPTSTLSSALCILSLGLRSCGGRRIDNRKPDGSRCINFTGLHDNLSASLALKLVHTLNSMENLLWNIVGSFPPSGAYVCVRSFFLFFVWFCTVLRQNFQRFLHVNSRCKSSEIIWLSFPWCTASEHPISMEKLIEQHSDSFHNSP